jgi:hypothetical protein
MKLAIIRQPAGLGDILFTYKIAKKINEKYNPDQIIWPICKEYIHIKDYIDTPANIHFVDERDEFLGKELYCSHIMQIQKTDEYVYIPLQFSCEAMFGSFNFQENLYSKYNFVGLSNDGWAAEVNLKRNYKKEEELYNLKAPSEPYILVNRNYGTNPQKRQDIALESKYKVIELDYVPGYNLFDWIKLIECAEEVHTLQTSLAYLLDILKKQKVSIYHRTVRRSDIANTSEDSFYYCKKIHNSEWIFET